MTEIVSVTPESQKKQRMVLEGPKKKKRSSIDALKNNNENTPKTRLRDNKRRIQKMSV